MIRSILFFVLAVSAWTGWSQENIQRYPLLISGSELRVVVRTTETHTFYFEVCDIPEAALTATNSELMDSLNKTPLACLRVNNAVFSVANERDLQVLNNLFVKEFSNALGTKMVASGFYSTASQAAAILNYAYAYSSFAAKSPRFGYLSLLSGFVFQGFMARDAYKTYQGWLALHPTPVEVSLQKVNSPKGPLAASITFEAFISALDWCTRTLYIELHPNTAKLKRESK